MRRSRERGAAGLLCLAVAAGCALSGRRSVPAPASALSAAPPQGVRVVLLWAAPVDLDLYVTDPGLETVYFANTPSGSGGKLVRDLACGQLAETTPTTFSEEVVWTKAHPGRYRVGVDFSDTCGRGEGEVGFRVIADAGGRRREAVGTLAPARFAPVVLEFDVLPTPERGAAGNSTKDGP